MIVDEQRTKVQREPRRELRKRPTWMTVDDGVTKIECVVLDVSPGGARIATDEAMDVGDSFELALVPDHPKRELCEVVWRRAKTYGVKFIPVPPPTADDEPAVGGADASEPVSGE